MLVDGSANQSSQRAASMDPVASIDDLLRLGDGNNKELLLCQTSRRFQPGIRSRSFSSDLPNDDAPNEGTPEEAQSCNDAQSEGTLEILSL